MNINDFNTLLSTRRPGAHARKCRGKIDVFFTPTARAVSYSGPIFRVAEQIGLIPTPDMNVEARRVLAALVRGETIITNAAALDTARYLAAERGLSFDVDAQPAGTDIYGRPMSDYIKREAR